jgi:hypothetical protein
MQNDSTTVFPPRSPLIIDLDQGVMSVKDSKVSTRGLAASDQILARYLAFVYHMRNLSVGSPIFFRIADLEVLSTALEIDKLDIESRLSKLMQEEEMIADVQRSSRLRTLAPIASFVLAACSAGFLVASLGSSPSPESETDVSTAAVITLEIVTDIGNGGAVEFNPGT